MSSRPPTPKESPRTPRIHQDPSSPTARLKLSAESMSRSASLAFRLWVIAVLTAILSVPYCANEVICTMSESDQSTPKEGDSRLDTDKEGLNSPETP